MSRSLSNLSWMFLPATFLFFLAACGPVKFSTDSSTDAGSAIPVTPATPTPGTTTTSTDTTTTSSLRDVTYSTTVTASNNKLDIILIIDDSGSMLPDNQKLAAKLSNFVSTLENNANLDWQACVTITNAVPMGGNTQPAWGASMYWQATTSVSTSLGYILKKGQTNLPTIFTNTINYIGAGWAGTDDERAIKAAYNHVYNGDYHYSGASGCYRDGAAIAYIIISDEDERSVGGDQSAAVYTSEYQPLETQDLPANFISYVKSTFGSDKKFTVNSIIVKPGDTACKASQDASGSISHYGNIYNQLSYLTGGGVGSICDSDFSTNMNLFIDKITDSLNSIALECTPVGNVSVTVTPTIGSVTASVQGMTLVFSQAIPAGRTLNVAYQCNSDDRSPSSIKGVVPKVYEEGFFARIVNFFKKLFF